MSSGNPARTAFLLSFPHHSPPYCTWHIPYTKGVIELFSHCDDRAPGCLRVRSNNSDNKAKTVSRNTATTCISQSVLDKTYTRRTGVERTDDAVKDCGLKYVRARGRVHARTQVSWAVSPTCRCNHQLRAGRRSRPRKAQATRQIL